MRNRVNSSRCVSLLAFAVLAVVGVQGCGSWGGAGGGAGAGDSTGLDVVRWVGGPTENAEVVGDRVVARGARNEWCEAWLRPNGGDGKRDYVLEWAGLKWNSAEGGVERPELEAVGKAAAWGVRAYRAEWITADTRGVSAVRDGGPGSAGRRLPRVLVPLAELGEGRFRVPAKTELVYVEWRAPLAAEPGLWTGQLTAGEGQGRKVARLELSVDDLALSEAPPMTVYREVGWESLVRSWPEQFGRVEPRLLSRLDPAHVPAIERLDQMVTLARANRVDVGFSRLQPTVKNTPREGLRFDWTEYDSVVKPWLDGELSGMTSGAVIGLPEADLLRAGGVAAREYWSAVVSHFDQLRLLGQTARPLGMGAGVLSAVGEERVRRSAAMRGAVSGMAEGWRKATWSAAGETGVGGVTVVRLDSGGGEAGVEWFYPGEAYGVRGVVPGVGLKWARRAQQDWELIELARRRGATRIALTVAQRMTQVGTRVPEIGGDLLSPVALPAAWDEGIRIVRAAATARNPGRTPTEGEDSARDLAEEEAVRRWSAGVDKPLVWATSAVHGAARDAGTVPVAVGFELTEVGSEASVVTLPEGWAGVTTRSGQAGWMVTAEISPAGVRYPVTRRADDLGKPLPPHGTLVVETVSGPDRIRTQRETIVPAALVFRAGSPPVLDGSLGDWTEGELVADGGLVRMLDRSSIQTSSTPRSAKATRMLAKWDGDALYVAIRAEGASRAVAAGSSGVTNFTREVAGRAYGEELVRIALGAGLGELRLLVKPSGVTVEAGGGVGNAGGTVGGVKFASVVEGGVWRAEMRIPAAMLPGVELAAGSAVQMNLVRHDAETGESSSWAGPIDRDYQALRGVLLLADAPKATAKAVGRTP